MGNKFLKLVVESIDLNKLANGIIDDVLDEALQKVVDDSSNKFDDAAKAMLWPVLSAEAKKLIAKEIEDLKKKIEEKAE